MISDFELFDKYEKQALDISSSAWISASAGGGKTTLIIKRILKILIFSSAKMFHVEHFQIFAITYTNEAASEIKKRIKKKLFDWKENEEILNEDLAFFEINNHFNDDAILTIKKNCRSFFDMRVFDLLKISTFHSFCFDIIRQFPNELNMDIEKFHLMNDESISEFLENILKIIFFKQNISNHSYESILEIMQSLIKHQDAINCSTWNNLNSNLKDMVQKNVPRGTFSYRVNKKIKSTRLCSTWNNLKKRFKHLKKKKLFHVEQFKKNNNKDANLENIPCGTFSCEINHSNQYSTWNNFIIGEIKKNDTKIGEQLDIIYKKLTENQNIKKIFNEYLEIFLTKNLTPRINLSKKNIYKNEQHELMFHVEHFSIKKNLNDSKMIFYIIRSVFKNFLEHKKQNNLMDFDDLINQTLLLLQNDYVLYILSKKIHYLIIDESQDNSKKQWGVIAILFENLFLESSKNIFIVGDIKQSIYQFQGAEPKYFNLMKEFFQKKSSEYGKKFYFIEWNFSFRMNEDISNYIDNFFNMKDFSKHLTSQENFILQHIPFTKKENVPRGTFSCQINHLNQCSTWNISKSENGGEVQKILEIISCKAPSDSLMILFRSRNQMMKNLIGRLKKEEISAKYSFYEKIIDSNTTQIILLVNETLRKCSTWNISEMNLLCKLSNENNHEKIKNFILILRDFSKKYSYDTTLESIINYFNEAFDKTIAIKLLNIAKKLKEQNLLSIENFNHYIYKNNSEVLLKSGGESKITISTIHSAKGLEADIVIIADDILEQKIHKKFYFHEEKKTFVLLKHKNCFYIDFFKNQIHREEYEESMRLLYVAMTRAKNELIIL